MNVFVLCTGRCASTTFAAACRHISNFTAAHESRCRLLGDERVAYPDRHIEVDNRLSWFLGRLDAAYGDEAFYVHLKRSAEAVAASFLRRWGRGIVRGYADAILNLRDVPTDPLSVCEDYCRTVEENVVCFLKDKTRKMTFRIENAQEDFVEFWNRIGAEGDLSAALGEWSIRRN